MVGTHSQLAKATTALPLMFTKCHLSILVEMTGLLMTAITDVAAFGHRCRIGPDPLPIYDTPQKIPSNVRPPVYNSLMNELETELLSLKAELEAENFAGSTDDENPDPRMTRVSEILTILEVFYWADYKRILIANFDFPADYWK